MAPPNSQSQQHHQLQPQQQQHQQSQVDSAVMPGSGGGGGGGIPAHLMGSGGPGSRLEYHQIPSQHQNLQQQQQHFQQQQQQQQHQHQQQQQQQQQKNPPPLMQRQNQGMIKTPGGGGGVPPNSAGMPPGGGSSGGVGVGVGLRPSPAPSQAIADPASLPWTVGSTDGSFATMMIMQQSQQEQQQQQHQHHHHQQQQQQPFIGQNNDRNPAGSNADGAAPPAASAGGATIGDLGEAKDATTNGNSKPTDRTSNHLAALTAIQAGRSLYHDRLFHQSPSSVESVLTSSCDVMGFDIAEMWLRTGPKTHQLTNSHLRPTSLEDSVRNDLVEVYYGEKSNERTHRLSPALCKRAKDANDVVWVTAHTPHGAEALRMSISNVRTAVAVPVCHEASNTNITIIYFSIRRIIMRPAAVEFLVHMSLCAAVASVNLLSTDGLIDRGSGGNGGKNVNGNQPPSSISKSDHLGHRPPGRSAPPIRHHRVDHTSITGARLDLQWRQLSNVEYLTDGGNSWIHTAVFNGKPVVVKTLKPECQDVAVAINEIEGELAVHSRLNHPNIVGLVGAGLTSKGVRFIVLERLDGGTLTQMLGYDTRIRDRRRRFWRKKQLAYLDVLRCSRAIASAMQYCHEQAIPKSIVLHRDLKPDNICFSLDGTVKLIDFGLARLLENADPTTNEVYDMSGETGSLRYMSPEVAEGLRYNHKSDVYSFGIILWELNAGKKPFIGLNREMFYERVVHGGERPPMNKKWPSQLCNLISDCWSEDIETRPSFGDVVERLDNLLSIEQEGGKHKSTLQRLSGIIDRHSTW
eukprot:CAMPEP_0113488112 /NCGR_PEP_ID=MMETSP0014_2-20120614/25850_1 /TAXON_ID=2857 /ORGANISM="Nitzschia sp." /LENGTH=801 /DNA_ID=CAMNT_0000381817 /DNA_START=334 /DNA_END=2736 /DNA_ORIENTATION=- /assembly_acc=CAM_ASM_000159